MIESYLNVDDFEEIDLVLRKIYVLRDLDHFVTVTVREVSKLIDAENASYEEINVATRNTITAISCPVAQKPFGEWQIAGESEVDQNPIFVHFLRVLNEQEGITDIVSHEQWQAATMHQTYYNKTSGEYLIAAAIQRDQSKLLVFVLSRSQSDFTERHRAMLSILSPHLGRAYKNAKRHTLSINQIARNEQVLGLL